MLNVLLYDSNFDDLLNKYKKWQLNSGVRGFNINSYLTQIMRTNKFTSDNS